VPGLEGSATLLTIAAKRDAVDVGFWRAVLGSVPPVAG